MKIRAGFVSNSSSSSFILCTKDGSDPVVRIEVGYDEKISTVANVIRVFEEDGDFEYDQDTATEEQKLREISMYPYGNFSKMLKLVKEGKTVFFGSIDRGEEGILYNGHDSNIIVDTVEVDE